VKALVTGASGFLGGHLVKALLERGDDVVALLHGVTESRMPFRDHGGSLTLAVGSVTDYPLMHALIEREEADEVYHLAASAIVNFANSFPYETYEANVRGTYTVLEAAHMGGAQRVIVASSDKAYGQPTELPIREDDPLRATAPYDVSKACADMMARGFSKVYPGLDVAVTRCSNFYGPEDLNFSRAVPGFMQDALQGRQITVRSDGSPTRDYLYIDDAVSGYLALMDGLRSVELDGKHRIRGEAFNFGTGVPTSVRQVAEAVVAVSGAQEPVFEGKEKPSIQDQYLNCDKAATRLGWKPKVDLKEGIVWSYAWYHQHFKGAKA